MWQYVFESWVWSIGGLVAGYMFGRTERQVRDLKRRLDEDSKQGERSEP